MTDEKHSQEFLDWWVKNAPTHWPDATSEQLVAIEQLCWSAWQAGWRFGIESVRE
jgi:hypothetical protein